MEDLAHVLKEVRPSWRGGAPLRWQPTLSRGGAPSSLVDFGFDTCLVCGEVAAHSPTLGSSTFNTWCALLGDAMRPPP